MWAVGCELLLLSSLQLSPRLGQERISYSFYTTKQSGDAFQKKQNTHCNGYRKRL